MFDFVASFPQNLRNFVTKIVSYFCRCFYVLYSGLIGMTSRVRFERTIEVLVLLSKYDYPRELCSTKFEKFYFLVTVIH